MNQEKQDTFQIWPLVKNPHFLSYPCETCWKYSTLEVIVFTKFHENRKKNLLLANFWSCLFLWFRLKCAV